MFFYLATVRITLTDRFFQERNMELLLYLHSESIYIHLIYSKSSFIWPVSVDALTKESFDVFCNRFPFPRVAFYSPHESNYSSHLRPLHRAVCCLFTLFWRAVRFELHWFSFRGVFHSDPSQLYVRKMRYNDYQSLASRVLQATIKKTAVTS